MCFIKNTAGMRCLFSYRVNILIFFQEKVSSVDSLWRKRECEDFFRVYNDTSELHDDFLCEKVSAKTD